MLETPSFVGEAAALIPTVLSQAQRTFRAGGPDQVSRKRYASRPSF